MVDVTEILAHWYAGRSKNQIAESLGLDRKTVRKCLAPAEAEGLAPGGPPVSAAEWRERAAGWFPELADTRLRQVTWPEIGKHHEFITGQLKAGVTVKTIWQRLRVSTSWRRRMRACAGMLRRTCLRRCAASGCGCCGWPRVSRARKPRSITGSWAAGPIR